MEPNTEDSMLAKRPRLKPLLLVEQVRSRAERERGSSSESAHSIGPSIGARLFHSDSIRGIDNVIALPVSPTLPTPPGTPKPFQLLPEIEDLEQARTPVLQYHLPFRYIAPNKAPVLDCNQSLHGILDTSYVSNQSTLAEAVHHVEPKIASLPTLNTDTIIISGAGSNTRQSADHRKGAARRTSPPQILKTTNHQLSQLNSSTSFPSSSVPRTESTFSCSSCSSDTSALSPTRSSRQSYPIRRRSSFSRSISCDSRGSYGTFGGQELAKLNQSRGESVLDRDSVAELSEEELDRLCNADSTPKITQQAPTMHKFPTSHSATIPLTCTSIMLPAVPIQSKLGNGVILTTPGPLHSSQLPQISHPENGIELCPPCQHIHFLSLYHRHSHQMRPSP